MGYFPGTVAKARQTQAKIEKEMLGTHDIVPPDMLLTVNIPF